MLTESQQEVARNLVMESLASWQPSKSDAAEATQYVSSGKSQPDRFREERQDDPINAYSTRRKGTAKLNCSEHVFAHLRAARIIEALPSHLGKWLKYHYGEETDYSMVPFLVELVITETALPNQQERSRQKAEQLITAHILKHQELREFQTRELVDLLEVGRTIAIRKYKPQTQAISGMMKALDNQALCEFYQRYFDYSDHSFKLDHSSVKIKITQN